MRCDRLVLRPLAKENFRYQARAVRDDSVATVLAFSESQPIAHVVSPESQAFRHRLLYLLLLNEFWTKV
jgi:hypothetical protein